MWHVIIREKEKKKPSALRSLTLFLNSLKRWNLDLLLPRAFHPYLFVQLVHGKLLALCYNGFVLRAQTLVQIEKKPFFFPPTVFTPHVCKRWLGVWELCRSIQLQNSPLCKMQGMALMWQLAMLAQVVFDRRQRKGKEGKGKKKKKQKHKGKVWEFFLIDELLLQKSILSLISHCLGGQKKPHISVFLCIFALSWLLRTACLI